MDWDFDANRKLLGLQHHAEVIRPRIRHNDPNHMTYTQ